MIVLLSSALIAAAEPMPPRLVDFAEGITLGTEAKASLYRYELEQAVYRGATRDDLGDLRVFDASGREVPHAIEIPKHEKAAPKLVALPVFPVQTPAEQPLEEVSLEVERNAQGTLLSVRTQQSPSAGGTTSYIVDASALDSRINALEVDWPTSDVSFVRGLRVDASSDLVSWQTVVYDAAIARLVHDGRELLRRRIELSSADQKYLRLSGVGEPLPVTLTSVRAELAGEIVPPTLQYLPLAFLSKPSANDYRFTLTGAFPVETARVYVPENNTLVSATLSSSAQPEGPWLTRFSGLLYRFDRDGRSLSTPELRFGSTTHRFWRLEVDPRGGGFGDAMPGFEMGYLPARVVFVARGEAPYTVAYGSAHIGPGSFSAAELIAAAGGEQAVGDAYATSGPRKLAGELARLPKPPETPWKKWLLWSMLVLGVLVVGVLAVRLIREMSSPHAP